MREADVEVILQRAKEKYPEAKPRIISDNGPQFIARDFKEFIRISGMTHVRTSPAKNPRCGPTSHRNSTFRQRNHSGTQSGNCSNLARPKPQSAFGT